MKQKNPKPLKPKADKFCKVHSRTVFECEMQFFQLATLISQEKKQATKVEPPPSANTAREKKKLAWVSQTFKETATSRLSHNSGSDHIGS